jgi:hypothetical protein
MSEDAKLSCSHLEAELGEYQLRKSTPGQNGLDDVRLWKVSDFDMLLTKNKGSPIVSTNSITEVIRLLSGLLRLWSPRCNVINI